MRKIVIIRNKKTGRLSVRIVKILDIEIVNGYAFISTNDKNIFIYLDDYEYIIQTPSRNNLVEYYHHYVMKKYKYF